KILYVLALMNSDIVNELIHTINPTANNSANYIKQIPYFEPPKSVLEKINNKVKHILSLGEKGKITECEKLHSELNHTINELYSNFRK
ncbi:restriction endonuclease, partial [Bifidobacteriaceae bacterium NR020]